MSEKVWSDTYKSWRIMGLLADETACTGYRCKLPLMMLQKHGAEVNLTTTINPSMINDFDFILSPRQCSEENYRLLKFFSWYNKCVIYDIDDDLHHVTPDNPAYSAYPKGGKTIKGVEKIISNSHGVTVTGPELSKWYSRYNVNVHEIDNSIDFSIRNWNVDVSFDGNNVRAKFPDLSKPEHRQGKFVIAYSGGNSHFTDLQIIGPTLERFLKERKDAHLCLYVSGQMSEFFLSRYDIPKDQVEIIQPVPFMNHPEGLFGMDVFLAPLHITQFNMAKSSLKLKESLAAGAGVIGTSIAPYARFHAKHPDLVKLVGKGPNCLGSWYEALDYYYENPEELEQVKQKSRREMIEHHSLEVNFHKYPIVWNEIYMNAGNGKLGKPDTLLPESQYTSCGSLKPKDPCPCLTGKYKDNYPGAWG